MFVIMFTLAMNHSHAQTATAPVVVTDGFQQVGAFDGRSIPELSGMAFSSVGDRAYVVNDSGDPSRFLVTTAAGVILQEVAVAGPFPTDFEDLGVGPCPGPAGPKCVYIGDIGDNNLNRPNARLLIVPELSVFGPSVAPLKTLGVKYSDGRPHNVESLGVHPVTGDVFLMTKVAQDPHIYKLDHAGLTDAPDGTTVVAKDIGTVDIGALFGSGADEQATGMAIAPSGLKFSVLTYTDAYEFAFDLSYWQTAWTSQFFDQERWQYKGIRLQQQEAIAYGPGGSLFYTTEVNGPGQAPLIKIPNVKVPPPPQTGPPVSVVPPSVSGQYNSGRTLSASQGTWSGAVPQTYAFQWKKCNATGIGCLNIPSTASGHSDTLPLTDALVGSTVRVRVTARNSEGSAWVATAPAPVGPAQPSGFPLGTVCNASGTAYPRPATYKHVIVFMFENRDDSAVVGSSQAPYFNSLRAQCGSSDRYLDNLFPWDVNSLAHYMALVSGSNCNTGLGSTGSGCITDDNGPSSHRLNTRSIFNQILDWKAYQEGMSSPCSQGNPSGLYWVKHNPPPYFTQVTDCSARDVGFPSVSCPSNPGATCGHPQNVLTSDLAGDTLPAFSFVTPDIMNDTHDAGVSVGDNWLHTYLPLVLASPAYLRGEVAVYVLWDEQGSYNGGGIPNLFVSPYIMPAISHEVMNHFAALRTIEDQLGVTERLGCASGTAPGGGACPTGSTTDIRSIFGF